MAADPPRLLSPTPIHLQSRRRHPTPPPPATVSPNPITTATSLPRSLDLPPTGPSDPWADEARNPSASPTHQSWMGTGRRRRDGGDVHGKREPATGHLRQARPQRPRISDRGGLLQCCCCSLLCSASSS